MALERDNKLLPESCLRNCVKEVRVSLPFDATKPSEVHNPKTRKELNTILTRKPAGRSGCSRSIANLKDVIHGSKRHLEKPPSCSPRSIGSSEFLNPITHEVVLRNNSRPGTPGPGGHHTMHYFSSSQRNPAATPPRRTNSASFGEKEGISLASKPRASLQIDSNGCSSVSCHKCGEQFGKWEALEAHHLSKHAVTELLEGDSSRKIVEIICRSSWLKSESQGGRIEKVLKVHNTQKTLARFEEYREVVKIKASKLPKKHPRCLADGNELLRFYGTTVGCSLGTGGGCSLCTSDKCYVCQIIRNGFSTKNEIKDGIGVFTTSTSGRAFESIEASEGDPPPRKALIVCRVIAGRVHRPLENIQEMAGQIGFDSLAGKVGLYSNIEELYLLNPRALLPCFVVICKS
nr:Zinc finger, C2H2 domain containing protein [Ipomoea batatas]